ncbi:MAG: hypothetical protein HUK14_08795 [Muribaculaceae bacterium]|nr:hypothetical protein [Muribaculaceae bacterium]
MSNNHGRTTQPFGTWLEARLGRKMEMDKRFSYGFCVDLIGGWGSKTGYMRWNPETSSWFEHKEGAAPFRIQQLYGEVKYRCLYLQVGLKEHGSWMLDNSLSSGDLVESANFRPIPEARIGFVDYQNIPLTKGWVQAHVVLAIGKPTDNDWVRNHYNNYAGVMNTGWWYCYKHVYLRSNPDKRLCLTLGIQASAQGAGTCYKYRGGQQVSVTKEPFKFMTLIDLIIPRVGNNFYNGNHLGSLDAKLRYRMDCGDIAAYFQWPWEDGSGLAKKNGFDGLWGVEFHPRTIPWLKGVVVEYLDFTNQSGPMHWAPGDHPGTTIQSQTTGYDNYYNNYQYHSFSYYGMAIGSAFLPSPIYNRDGRLDFACNRVRGVHLGVEVGELAGFSGRCMFSWRKGWGTGELPYESAVYNTSAMLEVKYRPAAVPSLSAKASLALDRGKMLGNNFGAMVTLAWNGDFDIVKLFKK